MRSRTRQPSATRPATTERQIDSDAWVDRVADEVQALLREHGLDFELCVFFDAVTDTLHAVGYDGSAARYFRSLEADKSPAAPPKV